MRKRIGKSDGGGTSGGTSGDKYYLVLCKCFSLDFNLKSVLRPPFRYGSGLGMLKPVIQKLKGFTKYMYLHVIVKFKF